MKRTSSVLVFAAFALSMAGAVFGQGAAPDTTKPKENPAEERKETPAQERAEEKGEAKAAKSHKGAMKMKVSPVDLNSGTKEELMKLPGITDELADKIIGGRPYASKSELLKRSILTKAEYGKVRSKLMIKKEKPAAK